MVTLMYKTGYTYQRIGESEMRKRLAQLDAQLFSDKSKFMQVLQGELEHVKDVFRNKREVKKMMMDPNSCFFISLRKAKYQ